MITEKEILTMLQNGEKADDIAQNLVDVLNKGKHLYEQELAAKAEKEAKAKEEEAIKKRKIEDMDTILDYIHDFIYDYYCDTDEEKEELDKVFKEFTAEKVIEDLENVVDSIAKYQKLLDKIDIKSFEFPQIRFYGVPDKKKEDRKVIVADPADEADRTIKTFLKSIGL